MSPLTTWDEFGEMLARAQRTAAKNYDAVTDNLMRGARHEDVFPDLVYALNEARADLNNLANLAIRLTPPERPDRPLEAVLADIRALGHFYVIYGHGYIGRDEVQVETRLVGTGGFDGDSHANLVQWREATEDGEARGPDDAAAAEARLAQIKELREHQRAVVALVETLSYRPKLVHLRSTVDIFGYVCGRDRNILSLSTDDPDAVTCPVCRTWAARNLGRLLRADIAISEAERVIGPEDVDTEHEAHVHVRWNVWKNEDDIGWFIVNANLNEEQAHRAIERRAVSNCEFQAVPVGQVPGGPPVTASDALVFLNPDPGIQPITGPTDAEELAREDARRVTAASEGEEA